MLRNFRESIERELHEITVEQVDNGLIGGFSINDDSKAEWALNIIKLERQERDRLIEVCEKRIEEYKQKIEQYKEQYEKRESYLKSLLNQYFQTVPHKKTKTQETYKLPSGTLKLKLPSVEYQRDDAKLLEWLKTSGMKQYIQTKETPKWVELKKIIQVAGDKVLTQDGEIVEGVTAVEKPATFELDV